MGGVKRIFYLMWHVECVFGNEFGYYAKNIFVPNIQLSYSNSNYCGSILYVVVKVRKRSNLMIYE